MSGFGTDVLAVTCILGGAAVSGAATLAWMDEGPDDVPVCVVETMRVRPAVVVTTLSSRSGGTVVVTPSVPAPAPFRRLERCAVHEEVVRIERSQVEMRRELTRALAGAERARAAAERARGEAERARARAGEVRVTAEEIARMREEAARARARAAVERARAEMERARDEASRIRHR